MTNRDKLAGEIGQKSETKGRGAQRFAGRGLVWAGSDWGRGVGPSPRRRFLGRC